MYTVKFGELEFPVAPEKLETKINNGNETMRLISGLEINIPKLPGLTEYSFTLLLPSTRYPFAHYPQGFQPPDYYLGMLKFLKQNKTPFPFQMLRQLPDGKESYKTEMTVLLEDYQITDDVNQGFDVTVDVNLKEYREYQTVSFTVVEDAENKTVSLVKKEQRPAKAPAPAHTVKPGETLWSICKTELGDGSRYSEIAKKNGIANPNEIIPGQVIRLA